MKTYVSQDDSQDPPIAPESIAQDGICGWGGGHCREEVMVEKERDRGSVQIPNKMGSLEVEFEVGDNDVQVLANNGGIGLAPPGFVAIPIIQETLVQVLGVLETIY